MYRVYRDVLGCIGVSQSVPGVAGYIVMTVYKGVSGIYQTVSGVSMYIVDISDCIGCTRVYRDDSV